MIKNNDNFPEEKQPEPDAGKHNKKYSLSIRLVEPLHTKMTEHCKHVGIPASSYIISLIEADLRQRAESQPK